MSGAEREAMEGKQKSSSAGKNQQTKKKISFRERSTSEKEFSEGARTLISSRRPRKRVAIGSPEQEYVPIPKSEIKTIQIELFCDDARDGFGEDDLEQLERIFNTCELDEDEGVGHTDEDEDEELGEEWKAYRQKLEEELNMKGQTLREGGQETRQVPIPIGRQETVSTLFSRSLRMDSERPVRRVESKCVEKEAMTEEKGYQMELAFQGHFVDDNREEMDEDSQASVWSAAFDSQGSSATSGYGTSGQESQDFWNDVEF